MITEFICLHNSPFIMTGKSVTSEIQGKRACFFCTNLMYCLEQMDETKLIALRLLGTCVGLIMGAKQALLLNDCLH